MLIAYARVSTEQQSLDRQVDMLTQYGYDEIFTEKYTGTKAHRPEFDKVNLMLRKGDILVVESLSRVSRSTKDLLNILDDFEKREIKLVSLKENIDTTTPQGRFMLTVFGALAELERENILERQREGIEIAKSEGKYKGRKPINVDEQRFKAVCKKWRAGEITATAAMKELGLKANTFYRRVNEMGM